MPRRRITVQGLIQGVGFRPFVFRLAILLRLRGFVRNDGGNVVIEVEGTDADLDSFVTRLSSESPPLARIHDLSSVVTAERGECGFSIARSQSCAGDSNLISPDTATCDRCLAELIDTADRRFGHAFLNCTNCGPRLTIVTAAPYDRMRTTMATFAMCAACRQEYENPADRRFHAQPIACPDCGPRLLLLDADGTVIRTRDPLRFAAEELLNGSIAALKSLGGYHLVCDARSARAVGELRRRKHRDAKPFAVMVRNLDVARELCEISEQEEKQLASRAAPIVLLRRRPDSVAEAVAPRSPYLGVMLAGTPVHHLLLRTVDDIPLVMTSGNRSDEPIAFDDGASFSQLSGLADVFITHNRPIHMRCDDSVMRVVAGRPLPIRRSRGYAPAPIMLPVNCPVPILALGGQLKAAFALGRDRQAVLSHHLGDLDHYEAFRAYGEAVVHYKRLFAIEPALIAHDLHPDYATTFYALEHGRPIARIGIQHHHAHLASCLAEHGLDEPAIGVIFDGTGYGTDGAVWGGEFLIGDYRGYRRAAHLRYVPMPGGDRAIREPWRMAVSHLLDAGVDHEVVRNVSSREMDAVRKMRKTGFNTRPTSSAGRLFDAVAALAGVRNGVDFEGQAAMELEWLATETPPCGGYPFGLPESEESYLQGTPVEIDTRPIIAGVVDDLRRGEQRPRVARRFHSTLVDIIAGVCLKLRQASGLETVALAGGVFMNAILLGETVSRLAEEGFLVYRHELVPPNDGGLCLGQLAIAAALRGGDNTAGRNQSVFSAPVS